MGIQIGTCVGGYKGCTQIDSGPGGTLISENLVGVLNQVTGRNVRIRASRTQLGLG